MTLSNENEEALLAKFNKTIKYYWATQSLIIPLVLISSHGVPPNHHILFPLPEKIVNHLLEILLIYAVIILLSGFFIKKAWYSPKSKALINFAKNSFEENLNRLLKITLWRGTQSGAMVCLGIISYYYTGNLNHLYLFTILSIFPAIVFRPNITEWRLWLDRVENASSK